MVEILCGTRLRKNWVNAAILFHHHFFPLMASWRGWFFNLMLITWAYFFVRYFFWFVFSAVLLLSFAGLVSYIVVLWFFLLSPFGDIDDALFWVFLVCFILVVDLLGWSSKAFGPCGKTELGANPFCRVLQFVKWEEIMNHL